MSKKTFRLVQLLKLVYLSPMVIGDIEREMGWCAKTFRSDLDELEEQGLLIKTEIPASNPTGPRTVAAYGLSPRWRGPQL